jgi:hypothetical protein
MPEAGGLAWRSVMLRRRYCGLTGVRSSRRVPPWQGGGAGQGRGSGGSPTGSGHGGAETWVMRWSLLDAGVLWWPAVAFRQTCSTGRRHRESGITKSRDRGKDGGAHWTRSLAEGKITWRTRKWRRGARERPTRFIAFTVVRRENERNRGLSRPEAATRWKRRRAQPDRRAAATGSDPLAVGVGGWRGSAPHGWCVCLDRGAMRSWQVGLG